MIVGALLRQAPTRACLHRRTRFDKSLWNPILTRLYCQANSASQNALKNIRNIGIIAHVDAVSPGFTPFFIHEYSC